MYSQRIIRGSRIPRAGIPGLGPCCRTFPGTDAPSRMLGMFSPQA
ncbi:hypothetical protein DESPIG_00633 [Desulfovibrio piger ATCC 29098]|uniref:Uncharacterized protein n=1 Tax=Desulfovibrio piger ATCC 29098 TaxID=411464 RepID=B6WRE3_9BACT|nr:hypothetical protein DESPIG_00633 [Desulfovibrio piger ATCC 29098]